MEQQIFVRPRAGLRIRDEYTLDVIPEGGRWVKYTTLVRKHIQSGDLVHDKDAVRASEEPATAAGKRKQERMVTAGSEG